MELIQWHACSLVVLQFNHCMCQGHVQLEDMGCSVGEYNMNALELEDKNRCVFASVRRGNTRTRKEAEEGQK